MRNTSNGRTYRRTRRSVLPIALLGLGSLVFAPSAAADFRIPVDDPGGGGGGSAGARLLDHGQDAPVEQVSEVESGRRNLTLEAGERRLTALGGRYLSVPVEDRQGGWRWLLRNARNLYHVIAF